MPMSPLNHKLCRPALAVLLACYLLFFFLPYLSGMGNDPYSPSLVSASGDSLFDTAEQDLCKNTVNTKASLQALPILINSHYSRIGTESLETNNCILGTYRCYLFQSPPRQNGNS
jgi:hypothetical protein